MITPFLLYELMLMPALDAACKIFGSRARDVRPCSGDLKTTQDGQGPRGDGPVPIAFCLRRRHRHPGLHCFCRSIPRLYAPLSTLRVLPHGSVPRMTRGQCGSLFLHCNGLSPSISCRSSRRTAARYLAHGLPCERFTSALAGRRASLGVGADG